MYTSAVVKDTRLRIKEAAIELFYELRYEKVSIVSICTSVGVANSVYYYYFKNKELLFREILSDLFDRLDEAFSNIVGNSVEQRLGSLLHIHFDQMKRFYKELAIYREGEFMYPEFDHALKAIYHSALEIALDRPVLQSEYHSFIGGIQFISRRFDANWCASHTSQIMNLLLTGVELGTNPAPDLQRSAECEIDEQAPQRLKKSAISRSKMIESGLQIIGEKGFDQTQIFEISGASGYSVGMFYKHFGSKQRFLTLLLDEICSHFREYLLEEVPQSGVVSDRLLAAITAYVEYFAARPNRYNLIKEAEFTSPESLQLFFDSIAALFIQDLLPLYGSEAELSANFTIGLAHYFSARSVNSDPPGRLPGDLNEVCDVLLNGFSA